jgi:hypothetical protein
MSVRLEGVRVTCIFIFTKHHHPHLLAYAQEHPLDAVTSKANNAWMSKQCPTSFNLAAQLTFFDDVAHPQESCTEGFTIHTTE